MEHLITILLIEDNPAQEGLKAKDLQDRGIDIGNLNLNADVPAIIFESQSKKKLYKHFQLKVLQHPEEIKEFISMFLFAEDSIGETGVGAISGLVPEVVVFDYKLSDNITINQEKDSKDRNPTFSMSYFGSSEKIRQLYNPNFLLINSCSALFQDHTLFLERKENRLYTISDFVKRLHYERASEKDTLHSDVEQLSEDELGLFAGVQITRMFRNHSCVGIPATIVKKDIETLHVYSKFFEWINEYDLGSMFSRADRDRKDWDTLISAAMDQLRQRILVLARSKKVFLNLSQLRDYARGNYSENSSLSVKSNYGTREYPLEALFIDCDQGDQKATIQEYFEKLTKELKTSEYFEAGGIAHRLVKAYQSKNLIRNRLKLSELIIKYCNDEIPDSNAELQSLLKQFGVSQSQLESCRLGYSPTTQYIAHSKARDYRRWKPEDHLTQRLVVLFTDILVHKTWQNFCKVNRKSEIESGILSMLLDPPTFLDLVPALFPIASNPLILPYHHHFINGSEVKESPFFRKDPFEIWLTHLMRGKMEDIAVYPDYPNNLSKTDIQLCESFAMENDLEVEFFPIWMKKGATNDK